MRAIVALSQVRAEILFVPLRILAC